MWGGKVILIKFLRGCTGWNLRTAIAVVDELIPLLKAKEVEEAALVLFGHASNLDTFQCEVITEIASKYDEYEIPQMMLDKLTLAAKEYGIWYK